MNARWALLLLTCLLSPAGGIQRALAEGTPTSAKLDPVAITGQQASDTIEARSSNLHRVMACGNEFAFAQGFALASRYGKEGLVPNPDPKEADRLSGLAQWPVTLMLGKAARLIDQLRNGASCEGILSGNIQNDWGRLTRGALNPDGSDNLEQLKQLKGLSPDVVVNQVYEELFDSTPGVSGKACAQVARLLGTDRVALSLSDACLARQIRAVMTHPHHGPWTEKHHDKKGSTPELPGTSAEKLPCTSDFLFNFLSNLSKFKLKFEFKVSGLEGDWDIQVIEYTRLASLLYRGRRLNEGIGVDVDAALVALNRRFLTVRSSPDQGATAREVFNLVTSCGNLPNQFGDAIDTVNSSGADPGTDRYSDEAKDAIGKKSFWQDLLRFFSAVLVVAAIALGAALVGIAAGIIAGALSGAVAVAVAVAVVLGSSIAITFLFGGFEETENHLLMQNTSRYLKNKLMMAELSGQDNRKAFDTIKDLNEDVRSWLLERLQRIAREDFVEYNSKPYNRLSHASILNLLDYACDVSWDYDASRFILNSDSPCDDKDRAVVNAAAAVMDLSAAKLAVGSLEGRRLIPYRRLATENYQFYNGRSILKLTDGADNQLAALQIWTGQMRHAPRDVDTPGAPDGVAAPGTFGDLAWYSTSQYRPDPIILDMAVNKTIAREQQYRHHTRERYASGNGWLITAGGTDERPAQGFRSPLGFTIYLGAPANDRGVGVPTTLMTGSQIAGGFGGRLEGRANVQEFLRFDGNKKDWGLDDGKRMWSFSDNNCVAGSFACGLAPALPADFEVATCRPLNIAVNFFVVDSNNCAAFKNDDPSAAIFIAIFQSFKVTGSWGFFEVAQQDAYGRSAVAFAKAIKDNNKDRFANWLTADLSDTVEYFAVTQNRLLKFTPKNENFSADRRACGVVNYESGARFTISNVPAAQQSACLSVGPRIFIDLNDAKNPIRRGEGGLKLESFDR